MKYTITLACITLTLFCSDLSMAQETFPPPEEPNVYQSTKTESAVKIDGRLSESDWESAQVITDFIQKNPDQGNPATYPTEVKILYDSDHLYIGAVCYQPESEVIVKNLERDFNYFQNDLFGIALDGFLDQRNSIVFR